MKFVIAGEIAQSCPASLDRADTAEKIGEHLVGGVRLEFVVFAPVGDVICVAGHQDEIVLAVHIQAVNHLLIKGVSDLAVLQPAGAQVGEEAVFLTVRHLPGGKYNVDQIFAQGPGQGLFKSSRYVSASSWVMRPKDSSKSETICLPLLTKQP